MKELKTHWINYKHLNSFSFWMPLFIDLRFWIISDPTDFRNFHFSWILRFKRVSTFKCSLRDFSISSSTNWTKLSRYALIIASVSFAHLHKFVRFTNDFVFEWHLHSIRNLFSSSNLTILDPNTYLMLSCLCTNGFSSLFLRIIYEILMQNCD